MVKKNKNKKSTIYKDAMTGKVIPKDIATSLKRQGFIGPQLPSGYMTGMNEGFIGPQLPSGYMNEGFIGPRLPSGYMTNPGEGFIGPQLPLSSDKQFIGPRLPSGYIINYGEGFIGPQLPYGYISNQAEGFIGPQNFKRNFIGPITKSETRKSMKFYNDHLSPYARFGRDSRIENRQLDLHTKIGTANVNQLLDYAGLAPLKQGRMRSYITNSGIPDPDPPEHMKKYLIN